MGQLRNVLLAAALLSGATVALGATRVAPAVVQAAGPGSLVYKDADGNVSTSRPDGTLARKVTTQGQTTGYPSISGLSVRASDGAVITAVCAGSTASIFGYDPLQTDVIMPRANSVFPKHALSSCPVDLAVDPNGDTLYAAFHLSNAGIGSSIYGQVRLASTMTLVQNGYLNHNDRYNPRWIYETAPAGSSRLVVSQNEGLLTWDKAIVYDESAAFDPSDVALQPFVALALEPKLEDLSVQSYDIAPSGNRIVLHLEADPYDDVTTDTHLAMVTWTGDPVDMNWTLECVSPAPALAGQVRWSRDASMISFWDDAGAYVSPAPTGSGGGVCSFDPHLVVPGARIVEWGTHELTSGGGGGGGGTAGQVGPNGRVCFAVAGDPGDVALVNLTPVLAGGAGNGQLVSSDVATAPLASNVNFGPSTVDPNVAAAPIGADGKVCYVNSRHTSTHVIADHLGTVAASAFTLADPSGAPKRVLDTRAGATVVPDARVCFGVAGSPGDVALVNLTPVLAGGPGNGQLVSSDVASPPVASNVNFGPGSIDPNVAAAPIGADGRVCYVNSRHTSVHLIADHLGTVAASAFTLATATGAPARLLDTRASGAVGLNGRVCFAVAGSPGDVALVNLTPVLAGGPGNGQLVSSGITSPPNASNVNFGPGSVDPNVAAAPIGADGQVCYVNSRHTAVHVIADHLGTIAKSAYTLADPSGAPVRKLDTRA